MRLRLEYRISVHLTNMELTRYSIIRGVAGRSFPGRQEVVALDNFWVAYKELPMALDGMINSPMASST